MEEQNKARIEQAKKMDLLIKRMDHMERARRENEAPLLQDAYAQKIKVSWAGYGFCFILVTSALLNAASSMTDHVTPSTALRWHRTRRCTSLKLLVAVKKVEDSRSGLDFAQQQRAVLSHLSTQQLEPSTVKKPSLCSQDDELDFAEQQKAGAIQHKQQYEHDFAEKQRMQKMQGDHSHFQQQIMSRRQDEFKELQVSQLAKGECLADGLQELSHLQSASLMSVFRSTRHWCVCHAVNGVRHYALLPHILM